MTSEKIQAAEKIHEKARYIRGRFLNSVACIERDIGIILTQYFSFKDRQMSVDPKTTDCFSLKPKKDALLKVVKLDYPDYWRKNRHVLQELDNILRFRNALAHSIVDVSEEALGRPLTKGVGFVLWNDGKPITDKEFEDWNVKTNMVCGCLDDVKRLLPFKQKSDEEMNRSKKARSRVV